MRSAATNYLLDGGVQWGGAPAVKVCNSRNYSTCFSSYCRKNIPCSTWLPMKFDKILLAGCSRCCCGIIAHSSSCACRGIKCSHAAVYCSFFFLLVMNVLFLEIMNGSFINRNCVPG